MAPMIAYTLPAMQLVCNLVIPEAPRANISNLGLKLAPVQLENLNASEAENVTGLPLDVTSTSDPPVTESSSEIEVKMLPDGYIRFPEFGAAFKSYREFMNSQEAAKKCVEEGGNLAVPDSQRKFHVIQSLLPSLTWNYVGIRKDESGNWVDVRTGSLVANIGWSADEPDGVYKCPVIANNGNSVLGSWPCLDLANFVCEIEI